MNRRVQSVRGNNLAKTSAVPLAKQSKPVMDELLVGPLHFDHPFDDFVGGFIGVGEFFKPLRLRHIGLGPCLQLREMLRETRPVSFRRLRSLRTELNSQMAVQRQAMGRKLIGQSRRVPLGDQGRMFRKEAVNGRSEFIVGSDNFIRNVDAAISVAVLIEIVLNPVHVSREDRFDDDRELPASLIDILQRGADFVGCSPWSLRLGMRRHLFVADAALPCAWGVG